MAKTATLTSKSSAKKTTVVSTAKKSVQDPIAQLAYQFYVDRGCLNGFDQQDWLRAEAIIKSKKK